MVLYAGLPELNKGCFMSIKQKARYTVSYNKNSDTLSDKLNQLLDNIVNLIRTNNRSLQITSRITYGSSEMTGAPLYSGNRYLTAGLVGYTYESDVVFLGVAKENIVLSLGFYNGRLVIAMNMDPYVESLYIDNWSVIGANASDSVKSIATGKASRWQSYKENGYVFDHYHISVPYIISNNKIDLDVVYWSTGNSNGYMFYNGNRKSNDVDLVIYKTTVDETPGLGGALYQYGEGRDAIFKTMLTAWSFDENLADNMVDHAYSFSDRAGVVHVAGSASNSPVDINSAYDTREWFALNCYTYDNNIRSQFLFTPMEYIHTLGIINGKIPNTTTNVFPEVANVETAKYGTSELGGYLSSLVTAYNLPYLNDGDVYLRQMRIPGFIKNCIGEIYLMWSPTKTGYKSGDIIEVDGSNYGVITPGAICWACKI